MRRAAGESGIGPKTSLTASTTAGFAGTIARSEAAGTQVRLPASVRATFVPGHFAAAAASPTGAMTMAVRAAASAARCRCMIGR